MQNLQIGSTGPNVEIFQNLLIKKGYEIGTADGKFGPKTDAAVKDFQTKNNLTSDGIVTDSLMALLGYVAPTTVAGIDLSAYQPKVDWNTVKGEVKFVYIKSSEGLHTIDTLCKNHAIGANEAGLKFGYYHFGITSKDATSQAQFFDTVMKSMPNAELPCVLDIETNDGGLSPQGLLLWIKTFFSTLQGLGHTKVMIYSGPAFLNENLPAGHGFGTIPLWLAEYTNATQPTLPHGWSSYTVWQYTGTGEMNGIGQCDINRAIESFVS